jgi:hypothetical protein
MTEIRLVLPSGRVITVMVSAPGDPAWAELIALVQAAAAGVVGRAAGGQ